MRGRVEAAGPGENRAPPLTPRVPPPEAHATPGQIDEFERREEELIALCHEHEGTIQQMRDHETRLRVECETKASPATGFSLRFALGRGGQTPLAAGEDPGGAAGQGLGQVPGAPVGLRGPQLQVL